MPKKPLFYTLLYTEDGESEDVMTLDATAEWVKAALKTPNLVRITIEPHTHI